MVREHDSKERGSDQPAEYRIQGSLCDTTYFPGSNTVAFTASQTQAIQCTSPSREGKRYTRWKIESAFETGLRQLVWTEESKGLKDAVALTAYSYLGRNHEVVEGQIAFPSGEAILTVLGSTKAVFRQDISFESQRVLRLTIQRYCAVNPLVKALLQDGQKIDMTEYISATLRYYEQHGLPRLDMEQRVALVKESFPKVITRGDDYISFVLVGNDERGNYRIGTNTNMFEEELARVEKFGPPYYRLRAEFLSVEKAQDHDFELLKETLEDASLFQAGVVVAVGKSCSAFS